MPSLFALFVGIDEYPKTALAGCVNDVRAARALLQERLRPGWSPEFVSLHDGRATRAAVASGITDHLGRARPGDTALFWFSGHGSRRPSAPDDLREGTGEDQVLVCVDSLADGGQPYFADKELGALLDDMAGRGVHVLAVLDCCFSGGASRGVRARGVYWQPWWTPGPSGPGTRDALDADGERPRRHTVLAASRLYEESYESERSTEWGYWPDAATGQQGRFHGEFTHGLLTALRQGGVVDPTYGALHAVVEAAVARSLGSRPGPPQQQHPTLHGPGGERFLSGAAAPVTPYRLRHSEDGEWEVDCGAAHGLAAVGAEFVLTESGDGGVAYEGRHAAPPRTVRVHTVLAERCLVSPVGWLPDPGDLLRAHPVSPSALAFPPVRVRLNGEPGVVEPLLRAVGASPLLTTGAAHSVAAPGLVLDVDAAAGQVRVRGGAGHPTAGGPLPLDGPKDAAAVVDLLEHLARWHQLRALANPDPSLSEQVRIEVTDVHGRPLPAHGGEIRLSYDRDGNPPRVRVAIHNRSVHPLWCTLLDLTDEYACDPGLYADFIGPDRSVLVQQGKPVWLFLPPGRPQVGGACVSDWLKLIVADEELNLDPFRLPVWVPPARRGRNASAYYSPPLATASRWGTAMVALHTRVP